MRFLAAATLVLIASPALAQGDAATGQKQFGQCRVCHSPDTGGADGVGPNLFGVYGAKAATRRTKFDYSAELKASKLTWDDATLDKWLADPGALVKGTKMEFVGLPRKAARDNVVAYLKTLK